MKKFLIFFAVLLIALVAGIYIFIPNKIEISTPAVLNITDGGMHRQLANDSLIKKWWPGTILDSDSLVYRNMGFQFIDNGSSISVANIFSGDAQVPSSIYIHPSGTDKIDVQWMAVLQTTQSPFNKMKQWLLASSIKKSMIGIFEKMDNYFKNDSNVYNIKIKKDLVRDTLLIATTFTSDSIPAYTTIYEKVDMLLEYTRTKGAAQDGNPMLSILPGDVKDQYTVRVGLPVNKMLPDAKNISAKRMPNMGNMLSTEVIGGWEKNMAAYKMMELYAQDHKRVSPAIPYFSLVTNRLQQQDSSNWKTIIYFPVM